MSAALFFHLLGAFASLAVVVGLVSANGSGRQKWLLGLVGAVLYQLATGVWLLVTMPNASLGGFCIRSLTYLVVVGVAVKVLRRRSDRTQSQTS